MSSETPSDDGPFTRMIWEWECLRARGAPPDMEAFLAGCPEAIRDDVRQAIKLAGPGRPPRDEAGEGPPLGPFGPYQLLEEIAAGGMGLVYRARQMMAGRDVAVKVIRAGADASPEDRARFLSEARDVVGLSHPNIVQVHDVGVCQGHPYFSMELAAGTLAGQAGGRRPPREIARLMEQVARAVHHAHERGVLHRDLKPANILIMADGTPKVADFGLARRVGTAAPSCPGETEEYLPADGRTAEGAILGTPPYMAPEQARGEARLTTAADVYGLGAVLYELLTGRPPFQGVDTWDTLLRVLQESPTPPHAVNPEAGPDLEALCLRCLAKSPAHRPPSALAVAEDLAEILAGRGSRYRQRGALDWLRHVWDREPTPAPYTWQILPIVGALFLACNVTVFLLVRNGGTLGAVWAAWGVYLLGHWLVHWYFTLKHFHLLPAGQYTAVMCSVGYWLATCAVFLGQSPLDPTRPARDCLPLWPSLMVVSGLTHFVTGLVFWGRLMATGLLVLALACVVRWAGDFAPLVHGVTMSAILWWWAWEARRRFLTHSKKA